MSSSTVITSTSKVLKNPGLTINLKPDMSGKITSNLHSFTRHLPSAISSLSNTPALEPDWNDEDDASDRNNDEVQYIYITPNSPFYRPPVTPRSSYITVSGFRFACDALAGEDSFAESNVHSNLGDMNVVIVDPELTKDPGSLSKIEWESTEAQAKSAQAKTDNEALRAVF